MAKRQKKVESMPNISANVLTAREIHLVDKSGNLRFRFSTLPTDGLPHVEMFDSDGHGRISMGLRDDGIAHIALMRSDGSTAIGMGMHNGLGQIAVFGLDGSTVFKVALNEDGSCEYGPVERRNPIK